MLLKLIIVELAWRKPKGASQQTAYVAMLFSFEFCAPLQKRWIPRGASSNRLKETLIKDLPLLCWNFRYLTAVTVQISDLFVNENQSCELRRPVPRGQGQENQRHVGKLWKSSYSTHACTRVMLAQTNLTYCGVMYRWSSPHPKLLWAWRRSEEERRRTEELQVTRSTITLTVLSHDSRRLHRMETQCFLAIPTKTSQWRTHFNRQRWPPTYA